MLPTEVSAIERLELIIMCETNNSDIVCHRIHLEVECQHLFDALGSSLNTSSLSRSRFLLLFHFSEEVHCSLTC